MKTFLVLNICFLTWIPTQAQTFTIVDENVLWIPAEPETHVFTITKTEMKKIKFIQSELGEIASYNLSFKMGDMMYLKEMENNTVESETKKLFIESGAGTRMYLALKIRNPKLGIVNEKYEFVLTFD